MTSRAWAPIHAIVWAQIRSSRNFFLKANKSGLILKWVSGLVWYGSWVAAAVSAAMLTSGRVPVQLLERAMPAVLFFVFFFWQVFPIVLASQGAFIDLRRLLVYPIPTGLMFLLEVVLRITTAFEMILLCGGIAIGLMLNPSVPVFAFLAIIAFAVFNLLLASGIKSLLGELFRKKGVREVVMLLMLLLMIGPQFLAAGIQDQPQQSFQILRNLSQFFRFLPWVAASDLVAGNRAAAAAATLIAWMGAAYIFARMQFARALRYEDGGFGGESDSGRAESNWVDRLARIPRRFLLDPVAIIVEKDIRTLARSPRFRLIFLMASTFGAVLWLPQAMRSKGGWMSNNYITMASMYGTLVLGEVIYWNVFGFERSGAQQWFVTPLPFREVLRAKNVVAVLFTLATSAVLVLVAMLLPIGASLSQIPDALAAQAVFLTFILGGGNLTSVYMPKAIDGEQAWRNNSSKTQFLLLLVYPFLSIPVGFAYLTRWATGSFWSFHLVLAVWLVIAWCFYTVATETAAEVAEQRKEQIVVALSYRDGPISLTT